MKILLAAAFAAVWTISALPGGAQTLLHRYSMNGSAKDSVGTLDGTAIGKVTFTTTPSVNGVANFPGGNSSNTPSFIRLPVATLSGLQSATIELFITKFSGGTAGVGGTNGYYQAIFDVSNTFESGVDQNNYAVLTANRDPANLSGAGIGIGSRLFDEPEMIVSTGSPLPTSGGLVTLVYQGFSKTGDIGTETIYFNGVLAARSGTIFSLGYITAAKESVGASKVNVVGIGGGSPFRDATFNGSMSEVRIWSGALSAAQVEADYKAGPSVVAAVPPAASTPTAGPPATK